VSLPSNPTAIELMNCSGTVSSSLVGTSSRSSSPSSSSHTPTSRRGATITAGLSLSSREHYQSVCHTMLTPRSRYVVLMMGFYFAPPRSQGDPDTSFQREKVFGEGIETAGAGFWAGASKLYA
jgi:hypothetical protein